MSKLPDLEQPPHKVEPVQGLTRRDDEDGSLMRELTTLRLLRLVDFIYRSASRAFPRASGLSDFEWRVFGLVCETPQLSINELSAVLHRGVAQVSRTVKKLVAAGLLHRANRTGGPGVRISATRLGRTVYSPLRRLARQRNAAIVAGIDAQELKILDRCIAIMTHNALAQLAIEQQLAGNGTDKGVADAELPVD
ncbi:MAG TPA: MarR family transcriptional regulator [Steroidobacteraceae bacterium]|nr:MarR family transcriptional regulator [Steroidobacteraceae bacterium]